METKIENAQKRSLDTRRCLIDTAGKLFAEYSYDGTGIRDICKEAGVNIAAIHYHFKDKLGLYETVLKSSVFSGIEKYPDPNRQNFQSAETYLEALIFTILSRIHRIEKSSWHSTLVMRERLMPSKIFKDYIARIISHDFNLFYNSLKEIAPHADDYKLRHSILCLSGQIGAYTFHPADFLNLCFPELVFTEAKCREIAQAITHFTITGLNTDFAAGKK